MHPFVQLMHEQNRVLVSFMHWTRIVDDVKKVACAEFTPLTHSNCISARLAYGGVPRG
jgi:hypothetical protein